MFKIQANLQFVTSITAFLKNTIVPSFHQEGKSVSVN
jgi:hypothetical protein